MHPANTPPQAAVALLAEGVDRNFWIVKVAAKAAESPSSRRAWIEIADVNAFHKNFVVALLAEGVDRNPTKGRFASMP